MFSIKRKSKNKEVIYSPAIGKMIPISEVNDAMFADKLLGDGVGLILEDDLLCSPCDGIISMSYQTCNWDYIYYRSRNYYSCRIRYSQSEW